MWCRFFDSNQCSRQYEAEFEGPETVVVQCSNCVGGEVKMGLGKNPFVIVSPVQTSKYLRRWVYPTQLRFRSFNTWDIQLEIQTNTENLEYDQKLGFLSYPTLGGFHRSHQWEHISFGHSFISFGISIALQKHYAKIYFCACSKSENLPNQPYIKYQNLVNRKFIFLHWQFKITAAV